MYFMVKAAAKDRYLILVLETAWNFSMRIRVIQIIFYLFFISYGFLFFLLLTRFFYSMLVTDESATSLFKKF